MNVKSNQINEDIQQNELLTVREVAAYLRVGRVTIWRWCKEGAIPAFRVGRNWRIPRDDLLDFLSTSQAVSAAPAYLKQVLEDDNPLQTSIAVLEQEEPVDCTKDSYGCDSISEEH
jgi:excisionase family DNA binding protein